MINVRSWKHDTLAAIDKLLADDEYSSLDAATRGQLRQDVFVLVCDQTSVFIQLYPDAGKHHLYP